MTVYSNRFSGTQSLFRQKVLCVNVTKRVGVWRSLSQRYSKCVCITCRDAAILVVISYRLCCVLKKSLDRTEAKHHRRVMNCRSEALEVTVEARQVEEAMLALLHTILLHRSTGKFHYKKEGTYSIGTVGTQDIDCDFIDFTFVRVSSEELDRAIRRAVSEFKVQTVLRILTKSIKKKLPTLWRLVSPPS